MPFIISLIINQPYPGIPYRVFASKTMVYGFDTVKKTFSPGTLILPNEPSYKFEY